MSCKYCEKLLKCPTNEKRKSIIVEEHYKVPTKEEFLTFSVPVDVPIPIEHSLVEIVRDVYPNKEKVFIHHRTCDIFKNVSNISFDINNCPFCGQVLKEHEEE